MKVNQKIVSICSLLDNKKASDIVVFDLTKRQNFVDYFIVCTLESSGHLRGVVDAVMEESEKFPLIFGDVVERDGYLLGGWVVLDFGDVFVHLFTKAERAKYSIDKFFADGGKSLSYKKLLATIKTQKQKEDAKSKNEQKKRAKEEKKLEKQNQKSKKKEENKK